MIAWYHSEKKRRTAEEEAKADSAESILLEAFGEKPNILEIYNLNLLFWCIHFDFLSLI